MSQNIVIKISAVDKTKKAFAGVTSHFKKMGTAAKNAAKIAAAAFTAVTAALTAVVASSMKTIDALAKTADKIGITTEALAGLQFAAEQSGVSTETMNMALQRFTRRVAEAANGSGEAVGALKELNLNAEGLMKLPLDVQMGYVADAMTDVGTQADRVRLAMKLFDSEGVALVNTMKDGSAGLDEMSEQAKSLGLAISRVDAAKIEQANDAWNRMQKVVAGLGNQFAVALAPMMTAILDDIVGITTSSEEWGTTGERVVKKLMTAYADLQDDLKNIELLFLRFKIATNEWGIQIQAVIAKLIKMFSPIQKLVEAYNWLMEALGKPVITDPFTHLTEAGEQWIAKTQELKEQRDALLAEPPPSEGIMAYYNTAKAESEAARDKIMADLEAQNEAYEKTSQIQRDIATKLSTVTVDAKRKEIKQVGKTEKEKKAIAKESFESGLKTLGQTNKKMFAISKAYDIAQTTMKAYSAATTTMAAYPGPVGIVMAGVTLAAGLANVAQIASQSFEGGGFTGYGARAGGLDGKGGRMAMVHPNETVIDHERGQSIGGRSNTVNFNISATDASGFDELLNSRRGEIMSMIDDALYDDGRSL